MCVCVCEETRKTNRRGEGENVLNQLAQGPHKGTSGAQLFMDTVVVVVVVILVEVIQHQGKTPTTQTLVHGKHHISRNCLQKGGENSVCGGHHLRTAGRGGRGDLIVWTQTTQPC